MSHRKTTSVVASTARAARAHHTEMGVRKFEPSQRIAESPAKGSTATQAAQPTASRADAP